MDTPGSDGTPPVAYRRSHHFPELDALRGLAAFVVVLGHFVRLWDTAALSGTARVLLGEVLLPFFNGRSSVILFFLLSGFVLTLPYKRGTELAYGVFLRRRLARIYLPYLAALGLALAGDWWLHEPVRLSAWFSQTWTAPLSWKLVLQHVLLVGNYDTAQVNTAFWSLAVEMRLSILFPLLCIPLLRWHRGWAAALPVLLVVEVSLPRLLGQRVDALTRNNLADMSLGVLCFVAGILLARWLEPLRAAWGGMGPGQRGLGFAAAVGLLEWSGQLGAFHGLWVMEDTLTIAGGCGVLVAALCSRRVSRVLNHRLPAWLGRISYSLYLVHATVLFALVHLFFGRVGRVALLGPYLLGALGLAAVFFAVVERPSIALSRGIGRDERTTAKMATVAAS